MSRQRLCESVDVLGDAGYRGGKLAGSVGGEARVGQRTDDESWQPDGVTLTDQDTSGHASIGALRAYDAHFDAADLVGRALKRARPNAVAPTGWIWLLFFTAVPLLSEFFGRTPDTYHRSRAGDRHLKFYETRDNLAITARPSYG